MHAEDNHAGIEAIHVLSSEKVDVVKVGRGKEKRPRDGGVEDYRVCVKPSVRHENRKSDPLSELWGESLDVHDPPRPLAVRLSHLLDDETQNVSIFIKETCFDNIMSQYMGRHAPFFPMFDMCIYTSFVDGIEFLGFVYHSRLSQPWASLVRVINDVPRDIVLANPRRGFRECIRSRWVGTVLLLCFRRCGITWWPVGEGEARARRRVWVQDIKAANQDQEEDEGSNRRRDVSDHLASRGRLRMRLCHGRYSSAGGIEGRLLAYQGKIRYSLLE